MLYKYHQIDFFAILIISSGEVDHLVDFKSAHLEKGDCLIITKGQVHAFDKSSEYSGHLLIFSEEFLQKHITQSAIGKIPFLYKPTDSQLIFNNPEKNQLLTMLLKEGLSDNPKVRSNQVGAALSYYLLNFVEESTEVEAYNKSQEYLFHFQKLLEKQYQLTRNAKDYADELNISYKHLNDICKSMINKTAKVLIDDYIILEAKRQLSLSIFTVKEVSFKLGFDEPTNFRKYFSKHTGYTPNQFIKKMKLVRD